MATPETIINLETSLIAARAAAAETISVYKTATDHNSDYWATLRINAAALQDRVEDLMRVIGYPYMDANCAPPARFIIERMAKLLEAAGYKGRVLEEARNFLKGR